MSVYSIDDEQPTGFFLCCRSMSVLFNCYGVPVKCFALYFVSLHEKSFGREVVCRIPFNVSSNYSVFACF